MTIPGEERRKKADSRRICEKYHYIVEELVRKSIERNAESSEQHNMRQVSRFPSCTPCNYSTDELILIEASPVIRQENANLWDIKAVEESLSEPMLKHSEWR